VRDTGGVMRKLLAFILDGWFQRATLLVLVLAGSACSGNAIMGPLEDARALWASEGGSTYSFELRPLCFCGFTGNARVTVENGVVTSVFDLEEERFLEGQQAQLYVTVEALFDILEDAESRDAFSIEVQYDPAMGFPTDFFIDYSQNTADEELGYQASNLTIG
jgi:uncharacterized protein DUF6174